MGLLYVVTTAVRPNDNSLQGRALARAEGIALYFLAHRLLGPRPRNSPVELVESTARLVRGSEHVQAR